jgi:hypothetical protein
MEVEEVRPGESHISSCGKPGDLPRSLAEPDRVPVIGPASLYTTHLEVRNAMRRNESSSRVSPGRSLVGRNVRDTLVQ